MRQAKLIQWILVVLCSWMLAPGALMADEKPIFSDPAKVNEDYSVQGEYMADNTPLGPIGAQIVALGEGKFDGMFFVGGLPGKGWERDDDLIEGHGTRDGNAIRFKGDSDEGSAVWENGVISVFSGEGEKIFEMKKIERASPTLGAKAPEGAVVLFDGTSVDHFENGKLVDGQYLGATNCKSKEQFGDHKLHIEFRTPFMPGHRGQARGNSGVYVQGRYEVQVLDSFGLEGQNNECGGIYSLGRPIVNMCLPPLTWQTYDIDFTAPKTDADGKKVNGRITVRHNGVLIHKDVELKQGTPGGLPMGDGPEALFLQDHSDPVVFRNIWVEKK